MGSYSYSNSSVSLRPAGWKSGTVSRHLECKPFFFFWTPDGEWGLAGRSREAEREGRKWSGEDERAGWKSTAARTQNQETTAGRKHCNCILQVDQVVRESNLANFWRWAGLKMTQRKGQIGNESCFIWLFNNIHVRSRWEVNKHGHKIPLASEFKEESP